MTHPKMKLLVIIFLFLLSGFASLATATNEPTICELLEQHRYPELGLLSITWYYLGKGLYIFTEPGYRAYTVPLGKLTYESMDLSEAIPLNLAEKAHYKDAFTPYNGLGTHRGTYVFSLYHSSALTGHNWKYLYLVITDTGARTGSYTQSSSDNEPDSGEFSEVTEPDGRELPDFTLASLAYEKSADLTGVVLSSDPVRFPGIILLSEFKVTWEDSKVTGLPPPKGETDHRPGFFLQVADNPDQVFLVPTSMEPDPAAQLLSSLPRAFLFQKHLVLFDSLSGCVHVIVDFFGDFSVNETKSRTFKRSNYPFETYFKCGEPLDEPKPNRCNVIRGTVQDRPTGVGLFNIERVVSYSKGATVGICLVVGILVVGLIYTFWAKKKDKLAVLGKGTKGKSAPVKPSTSSSAVSGRSKRSSKSTVGKSTISGHGVKSKASLKRSKSRTGSKTSLPK